jgi:hypothetical protein
VQTSRETAPDSTSVTAHRTSIAVVADVPRRLSGVSKTPQLRAFTVPSLFAVACKPSMESTLAQPMDLPLRSHQVAITVGARSARLTPEWRESCPHGTA